MIGYFESLLKIIEKAVSTINEEKFNQLIDESVKALKKGKKIIVSGLGKNVPICDKFVGTMVSLGMNAAFLHTNSAVHGDLGIVKKDDIVILLTKSGETAESIYLAEHLKKKEADLWLLTFSKDSTLAKKIEKSIVLQLEHEGDMWDIVPNNSTTLNLIFLQAVAMNVAEKMGITLDEFKANHPGGHIGEMLKNG